MIRSKISNLVFLGTSKKIKISLEKANPILKRIRGKRYVEVLFILANSIGKAADAVWLALDSVVSNAVNKHSLNKDKIFITEAYGISGPILKRLQARAKGRAFKIQKKSCKIVIGIGILPIDK